MKIFSFFISVCWLLATEIHAADAPFRSFTDIDGRKIEAVLVRATLEKAILRTADGREHEVPLSRLSADDRKFVIKQAASDPKALVDDLVRSAVPRPAQYRFSASWTKAKMPNSEHNVTGLPSGYDGKADNWQCKLRLTNSNTVPLQKLVVVYQVDVLRDRNMGDKTDRLIASHVVDAMKPGESVEITTKPVELARIVLKKGYVSKSGGNRTAPMTDTIRGMAVKVVDTGMEAWHWESPGVINKIELPSSVKPATPSK